MSRPRSDLSVISKRNGSGKSYFYAVFRESDSGPKVTRSLGVPDDGTATARSKAARMARQRVYAPEPAKAAALPTFKAFATGFWDFDGDFVSSHNLRNQDKPYRREYVYDLARQLNRWPMVLLGELSLDQLTPSVIDDFFLALLRGDSRLDAKTGKPVRLPMASQSVLHVKNSMMPVFREAVRTGLLRMNPVVQAQRIRLVHKKQRDAFRLSEVQALLDVTTVEEVWAPAGRPHVGSGRGSFELGVENDLIARPGFNPWLHYGLTVLTALTGARVGAVLPLRREDVRRVEEVRGETKIEYYVVTIRRTLNWKSGIRQGTKTAEGTEVPVDVAILDQVLSHLPSEGPLFASWGKHGILTPRSPRLFLRRALTRIGIPREEQVRRGLGFHSLRHTFVTQAIYAGLSREERRGFTEHRHDQTEAIYTHPEASLLVAALPVQRSLVGGLM